MGRYEPDPSLPELSLPGLSRRIINASMSVCGSDPRDKESINISSRIGDSFLEKVLSGSRRGRCLQFALPLTR